MNQTTYSLYSIIINARMTCSEKFVVDWPDDFKGPQNRSKRNTALVEAKKHKLLGDKKLYFNLNNGTEYEGGKFVN